ncbi:MAG: VOC family protein [Deltaproteobacteria bacterium]|nr:VOC family protein [Deltaproteobacteria bacterium]
MQLYPYLSFDGRCAQAMAFYAEVFGGEPRMIRFGDSPAPVPPEAADRILHAELRTAGLVIQASDTVPGMPPVQGGQISMSLSLADEAEQDAVWAALSQDAEVLQPLSKQFWGRFGMLRDRYGVTWMLNLDQAH